VIDMSKRRWILTGLLLANLLGHLPFASALAFTDPTNDLFDVNGTPTIGEGYLDIVETEVILTGSTYVARLKMVDSLPTKVSSSVFIEWDMLMTPR